MKTIAKLIVKTLFFFQLKKTKELKNTNIGDKIYIIADSKEVAYMDIEVFDDAPAIFFNYSFLINGVKNRLNTTYVHINESAPYFYRILIKNSNIIHEIKNHIKTTKATFITHISNIFIFGLFKYYFMDYLFDDDFSRHFYNQKYPVGYWSIMFSISFAIYLGYRDIFVVGFSQHEGSFHNHWYEKEDGITSNEAVKLRNHKDRDYFFKCALKKSMITAITAFPSKDSYFHSIDYETYTSIKPKMKTPCQLSSQIELLNKIISG